MNPPGVIPPLPAPLADDGGPAPLPSGRPNPVGGDGGKWKCWPCPPPLPLDGYGPTGERASYDPPPALGPAEMDGRPRCIGGGGGRRSSRSETVWKICRAGAEEGDKGQPTEGPHARRDAKQRETDLDGVVGVGPKDGGHAPELGLAGPAAGLEHGVDLGERLVQRLLAGLDPSRVLQLIRPPVEGLARRPGRLVALEREEDAVGRGREERRPDAGRADAVDEVDPGRAEPEAGPDVLDRRRVRPVEPERGRGHVRQVGVGKAVERAQVVQDRLGLLVERRAARGRRPGRGQPVDTRRAAAAVEPAAEAAAAAARAGRERQLRRLERQRVGLAGRERDLQVGRARGVGRPLLWRRGRRRRCRLGRVRGRRGRRRAVHEAWRGGGVGRRRERVGVPAAAAQAAAVVGRLLVARGREGVVLARLLLLALLVVGVVRVLASHRDRGRAGHGRRG